MSGFGLYVHWPFCLSKCPYCDFNSHVRDTVDDARWCRAYLAELDRAGVEAGARRLDTIFFGGGEIGKPRRLDRGRIRLQGDFDVVRRGPYGGCRLDHRRDRRWVHQRWRAAAGVNRVSLGVQALDDDAVAFLGREHSAAEAIGAVELAAGLFPRFSFDLIYARPDQTPAAWEAELTRALTFVGDHLSLYQLTIEPGTAFFGRHQRGEALTAPEEAASTLYGLTQQVLAGAGLPAYEISNHAAPGAEARHNMIYWRGGDYAAIGPGAHARLNAPDGRRAIKRFRLPEKWLETVEAHGHASDEDTLLADAAWLEESLMMGLRLSEGVDVAALERRHGGPLESLVDAGRLEDLVAGGFLERSGGFLRATANGRQRLNAVLSHLLA